MTGYKVGSKQMRFKKGKDGYGMQAHFSRREIVGTGTEESVCTDTGRVRTDEGSKGSVHSWDVPLKSGQRKAHEAIGMGVKAAAGRGDWSHSIDKRWLDSRN